MALPLQVQCAALLRLRATHPHRLRPQRTIPGPLLLLPASIAALMLLASPLTNWLSAAALFACTLLVYALIHVVRITRGHVPGAPPSARAAALADTLRVAERGPRGGAQDGDHDLYDGTGCYDGGGGGSRSSGPPGDAWFRSLLNSYRRVPAREQAAAAAVQAFELEMHAVDDEAEQWTRDDDGRSAQSTNGIGDGGSGGVDGSVDGGGGGGGGGGGRGGSEPARLLNGLRERGYSGARADEESAGAATHTVAGPPSGGAAAAAGSGGLLLREGEEFVTEVSLDDPNEIIE